MPMNEVFRFFFQVFFFYFVILRETILNSTSKYILKCNYLYNFTYLNTVY